MGAKAFEALKLPREDLVGDAVRVASPGHHLTSGGSGNLENVNLNQYQAVVFPDSAAISLKGGKIGVKRARAPARGAVKAAAMKTLPFGGRARALRREKGLAILDEGRRPPGDSSCALVVATDRTGVRRRWSIKLLDVGFCEFLRTSSKSPETARS